MPAVHIACESLPSAASMGDLSFAKRGLLLPKRPCESPSHFSSSGLGLLAG